MKTFPASVVTLLVVRGVMADLTVLMYTDSSFEDYVGQVRFDSTDRCYPLCSDTEAVAAFVWDAEPYRTQLTVFEDFECRGRFVTGERSAAAEFAAIAARHKIRSFILSTTKSFEATRGIVHSCEEKSDLVFKPFNDTAVWM